MNLIHPKLNIFENIFAEIFPVEGDQAQFNPTAVTEENLYKLLRYPVILMVIIAAYTGGKNIQKLFQELTDIEKDDEVYDYCISEFHFDIYIKVLLLFNNKMALFAIDEIRELIYSINCFIALCCAMIIQIRTKKKCDHLSENDILGILSSESINNNNTLLTNRFIHTWIHLGFSQIDDDLETDNFFHTLPIQDDEHNREDLFYYSGYNYLISSMSDEVGQISININSEGENYSYLWLETLATDIKDKERPLKLSGFNFFILWIL